MSIGHFLHNVISGNIGGAARGLGGAAFQLSGAQDVADAFHNPGNWKADLRALGVVGGYALPGLLEGRLLETALGKYALGSVAGHASAAFPALMQAAANPTNPGNDLAALGTAGLSFLPTPIDKVMSKAGGRLGTAVTTDAATTGAHDLMVHPQAVLQQLETHTLPDQMQSQIPLQARKLAATLAAYRTMRNGQLGG